MMSILFVCTSNIKARGNRSAAKEVVTEILTQFGWETEDMGKAESDRAIDP